MTNEQVAASYAIAKLHTAITAVQSDNRRGIISSPVAVNVVTFLNHAIWYLYITNDFSTDNRPGFITAILDDMGLTS